MATASLDILHTAALRLREAADRFIVAFEQAAAEAARTEERPETPARLLPRNRGRVVGSVTEEVLELSKRAGGITAGDVVPIAAKYGLQANASTADARLGRLVATGKLVSIRSQYSKYGSLRYFATAELAETWAAEQGPPPLDTHEAPEIQAQEQGLSTAEVLGPVAYNLQSVRPSAPMDGVDIDAVHRRPQQIAAMVEADAPAVAKALAVIAPTACPPQPISHPSERDACAGQPASSAPPPKPYIPPTPTRARGERREELTAAAYVAPIAKPTGEPIVPSTAKITKAPTPIDKRFYVDPEVVAQDVESFSAQWKRLRGEGSQA